MKTATLVAATCNLTDFTISISFFQYLVMLLKNFGSSPPPTAGIRHQIHHQHHLVMLVMLVVLVLKFQRQTALHLI